MNAGRRAVVYDVERERQIDVFVGEFQMCHKIDIAGRLEVDNPTIPLAELLLTKLQIVQLNRKDIVDIAAILYDHEVGEGDRDMVNGTYIAQALSGDWGAVADHAWDDRDGPETPRRSGARTRRRAAHSRSPQPAVGDGPERTCS